MNYHNITKDDMLNGDGLRVVLWTSGCTHHCDKCQNPQTWNPVSGVEFDSNAEKELFAALNNDYISGITFSGGDPLHENNIDKVRNLIDKIHILYPEKTIWLYSGYKWEELNHNYEKSKEYLCGTWKNRAILRWEIVTLCDVFVDGEYIDGLRDTSLRWRGSSNQRVIDVKKTLSQNEIILHCL